MSHDRELLNGSVTSILHLEQRKLTLYSGGYDTFEETRREKQRLDLKLKKKQDDERRRIEAFVIRFKAKASKAKAKTKTKAGKSAGRTASSRKSNRPRRLTKRH